AGGTAPAAHPRRGASGRRRARLRADQPARRLGHDGPPRPRAPRPGGADPEGARRGDGAALLERGARLRGQVGARTRREARHRRGRGHAGAAGPVGRARRGHHHVAAGPAPAARVGADHHDQLGEDRRRPGVHAPGRADRRGPHAQRRPGRAGRRPRAALAALRPGLPGLPRHVDRRPEHAQHGGGGDQPGLRARGRAGRARRRLHQVGHRRADELRRPRRRRRAGHGCRTARRRAAAAAAPPGDRPRRDAGGRAGRHV
ncbi:MAG: Transcriptional regulator, DeoR family, partial [uncultured Frankineae bacterium]